MRRVAELTKPQSAAGPVQTVRSLLFDALFYGGTFAGSFLLLWTLALPRKKMLAVLTLYFRAIEWAEKRILGLEYRVLGREHVPKGAAFILAAKHQSAWETLKLNTLLDDPAIVLKHELLKIPIWGWYAARAELVPVERGARGHAIASLVKGGRRAAAQQRPIVIFPQGTRVRPGQDRPYKVGVAALYEELGLPVVPMALNSGVFWPRGARIKRSGCVTVEFLEPIQPGLSRDGFLDTLRDRLETASDRLVAEAGGPRATARVAHAEPDRSAADA